MNRKLTVLLFILFILGTLSIVTADKVNIKSENGYVVLTPEDVFVKKDSNYTLNIDVYEYSNGTSVTDSDAECYFSLHDPQGEKILHNKMNYDGTSINGSWFYEINSDNFDNIGKYNYFIECREEGGSLGGSRSDKIFVTITGNEATTSTAIFHIGLISVLGVFMIISILGLVYTDHYIGKFSFFWVFYLLLIAVTYVGWDMSATFIYSNIAIVSILRIFWWVIFVASFPLFLFSLAYILYIHTVTDEVERMMDKGMSPEEAYRRTGGVKDFFNGGRKR